MDDPAATTCCGKPLLARCLPGLLPPLTEAEAIQHRALAAWWAGPPTAREEVHAGGHAAAPQGRGHHA